MKKHNLREKSRLLVEHILNKNFLEANSVLEKLISEAEEDRENEVSEEFGFDTEEGGEVTPNDGGEDIQLDASPEGMSDEDATKTVDDAVEIACQINAKIVAKLFNKDTLNYIKPTEQSQKGFWNKIKNSYILTATEKSHEEILYPALKKLGINIKDEAGNVLPFKKLIKALKEQKANPIAQKALEQIKVKNYQQLAGYLYSGLVLGIGITELNIIITKLCEKNKKQPEAKQTVDKMKVSNEFIKRSAQNDSKTFGAFLKSI